MQYNTCLSVELYTDGMTRRKHWETFMAYRTLVDFKCATKSKTVLGVGAGTERTIYDLAEKCHVIASDLYHDAGEWRHKAPPEMMDDPMAYAPKDSKAKAANIEVVHADMRELPFDDDSMDGVFSSSSIEHLPTWDDMTTAVREMARVVKPGGVVSLTTEWKLWGARWQFDNVHLFDKAHMYDVLINPSNLEPVDDPYLYVSEPTLQHVVILEQLGGSYKPEFETAVRSTRHEYLFTSVHLALRKPT